jgi:hypothetical protein
MSTLQLLAADGNRLSAYVVKPEGTPLAVDRSIEFLRQHVG